MIGSADEFYRLRTSDDPAQYQRAAHDEAPEDVWRAVITAFPDMRVWVAHNKTIPVSILETLADDPDWRVRHRVASKRKLPGRLQLRLVRDPHEGVRRALVHHARLTPQALALLADDAAAEIRERAKSRLASAKDNA
jgi:hypothetical protein